MGIKLSCRANFARSRKLPDLKVSRHAAVAANLQGGCVDFESARPDHRGREMFGFSNLLRCLFVL